MKLHHDVVRAPGAMPTRAVFFLHGILGSGSNLRSHARKFVQEKPDFAGVLVDLRAHGSSLGTEGSDSLAGAAADLAETAKLVSLPVHGVVGHSFGGKVALAYANLDPTVPHVMTLDSAPGPRPDARGSESTLEVLALLEAALRPWESRDVFVAYVESQGQSRSLGTWLAMNLELKPEGWVFRLSLDRIHRLLDDYFEQDLWNVIERESPTKFHLVIGTRSRVFLHEDRVRASLLESQTDGRVTVDLLDAGHWIHVEDPQGVSRVIAARL